MIASTTIGFCLWAVAAGAGPATNAESSHSDPPQQSLATDDMAPSAIRSIQAEAKEPPIRTAAACLQQFLQTRFRLNVDILPKTNETSKRSPESGTVLLGTPADTPAIARWIRSDALKIYEGASRSNTANDAYALAMIDGCVVVAGASPRAVLYGTFELQDILAEHGGVPPSLQRRAEPRLGLRLLHPRFEGGFTSYRRSDFEFIARCGANVAHLSHDWMGEKTLFSFVPCPEFPRATPASLETTRSRLRQYLDWCREFGLNGAMWLCEVPCQGGPWVPEAARREFLDRFPADCLSDTGTYQGKVLCLAHPTVEKAYRAMARRFFTDFPGIRMLLVFTLDSNGELCDPKTCPRHRGMSKLAQYNHLLALLEEEGRKVSPDVHVISVGWGWNFRGDPEFLPQQAALPPGVGLTSPPDGEAWSFDRKATDLLASYRDSTRKHRQVFLGYDIFLYGDDCWMPDTKLYDFPFGIAKKWQRWELIEADGVFDQWGTQAEYVQCNAVAFRELLFHPEYATPEHQAAWAESLAARRFGKKAAAEIVMAWGEIEAAQQIQSDHTYYWHHLRPNWAGPVLESPLTPAALRSVVLRGGEPPKPWRTTDYSPFRDDVARAKALGPALSEVADHFQQAAKHLQAAKAMIPSEQRSTLDHWYSQENGAPPIFTPSQLLDAQITAVMTHERMQRRMSRFFTEYARAKSSP